MHRSIAAQIRSDQGGTTGIGFAVPIDAARRSLRQLLTKDKVEYAYAGLQAEDVTPSPGTSGWPSAAGR